MKNKKAKIIIVIAVIIVLAILLIVTIQNNNILTKQQTQQLADTGDVETYIGDKKYIINDKIENEIVPTISAGMIPIKLDGEYWTIVDITDNTWFNYTNGVPAYMMLNDGIYQSEEYYQMPATKQLVKAGTQIEQDSTYLGSIYMWVPRYAYNENGDVIYIKQENVVAGTYTLPDIFKYIVNGKEFSLSGIWVEVNESDAQTKANALNNGEEDTTYGFLAHTKANVMTDEEQYAIQIFIENLSANGVGVDGLDEPLTTNHTILKIIDINKLEPIVTTEIHVGDIVNYDASSTVDGETYTYTTDSSLTGSTTSSTFKSTDTMKWKVLGINETTGEIELIAADDTPSSLTLYGKTGLVNAESVLNDISAVYGHGYGATSARSVTIEDIEKYSTYDKTTYANSYSSTGKWGGTKSYTSGNFYKEIGTKANGDKIYATTTTTASSSSPITMTQTYYYCSSATNYFTTKVGNMLIKNTKGNNRNYWLATRSVYLYSECLFPLRFVGSGYVGGDDLYKSSGTEASYSHAVSPVVTLDSSILYLKNSSGEWNIILNQDKSDQIIATGICSDTNKGIVTITVSNEIEKIIDEEGIELTLSTVNGITTGVSNSYRTGIHKFYIIDKNKNIKEMKITVEKILLEVGDIINYDASNTANSQVYTYTTDSNLTGSTESSTFKSTDEMRWKVLSVDKTTEEVEIIAADDTPSTLTLYGKTGFVNAESILNDISAVYGHGYGATSARSVTIEDIEKYSTFDKTTFENSNSNTGKWGGTRTYTSGDFFEEIGTKENGYKIYATTTTSASSSNPITMTHMDYCYNNAINYFTTKVGNMLIKNTKGNNRSYWIASHTVELYSSSECCFNIQVVVDGSVFGHGLYYSRGNVYSKSRAVSPVVTLNSSVQYAKNSNGEWVIK